MDIDAARVVVAKINRNEFSSVATASRRRRETFCLCDGDKICETMPRRLPVVTLHLESVGIDHDPDAALMVQTVATFWIFQKYQNMVVGDESKCESNFIL